MKHWQWVALFVLAVLLNALPCLTLAIMNLSLLCYALKKTNRTVNKMNLLIVVLVTLMFLLPMLPYFVYYMVFGNEWDDGAGTVRFVTFIMFISSFANPPIYLLTNENFKKFTVSLVQHNKVHIYSDSVVNETLGRLQEVRMSVRRHAAALNAADNLPTHLD